MGGVALVTSSTLRVLLDVGVALDRFEYEDIASALFGRKGLYVTLTLILVLELGAAVSHTVLLADTCLPILRATSSTQAGSREGAVTAVLVGVVLPICLQRNMTSLAAASLMSTLSVALLLLCVLAVWAKSGDPPAWPAQHAAAEANGSPFAALMSASTFVYTFVCHDAAFQVYHTLVIKNRQQWSAVVALANSGSWLMSAGIAYAGLRAFGPNVTPNVLNAFGPDLPGSAARVALTVTAMMTIPLNVFMSRHAAARLLWNCNGTELSPFAHVSITVTFVVLLLVAAFSTKNIAHVQQFVGGFAGEQCPPTSEGH
jgi:amino acid permease